MRLRRTYGGCWRLPEEGAGPLYGRDASAAIYLIGTKLFCLPIYCSHFAYVRSPQLQRRRAENAAAAFRGRGRPLDP